ncbi:FAD binding domain-containing protein [Sarocladium implicatum]|nr:FAD binding domain-containing protein [Sarocladium implicatum]
MALREPVLIIGAGVVGLTLAHALKKSGIAFEVYERDAAFGARDQGWAITIHWGLPILRDLLDDPTLAAIEGAQVDPEVGRNDNGNFLFLNLETLETKFRIPPNERRRVNREKFRLALYDGVKDHVHFGKRLRRVEASTDQKQVSVVFEDGSSACGALLVGAEGTNSQTRQTAAPDTYRNNPLPVRFMGAAVRLTPEEVKPLRDIDPLLFQGCHPTTGNFLWVSMISTPESNGSLGTEDEHYLVQINISWLKSSGDSTGPPEGTDESRLEELRGRADGFHPLLRDVIHGIPSGTPILDVVLQDWPCLPWDNQEGLVTLVGDAAHAMTMYRGEAANHGIMDARNLANAIASAHSGTSTLKHAIKQYEEEMRDRTRIAVELSRQACLEAHDFNGLNENSAVIKRRALK